jgi:hypothetical protein
MNRTCTSWIVLLSFLLLTLFLACDVKPKNPAAEYGDTLTGAYKGGQHAAETANLDAVKKTVEMYRATHDNYPHNLDEIKELFSSEIDLSRYDYKPENGSVSLKK